MKRGMMLVAVGTLFAFGVGLQAEDPNPREAFDDANFVRTAYSDGLHEVELGRIASEKASDREVKQFAERMVKDHTTLNENLRTAAKAADIQAPEKINETHQKHINKFKTYEGDNFDRDYMKHMVTGHEEAVALYTRASKEAKNEAIKEFATKNLPKLEEHLEAAKKLNK